MAKKKNTDLDDRLGELALEIADTALAAGIPFEQKIEALKVAGGYHVGISRVKLKMPEEDENAATFGNFRRNLQLVDKG